VKEAATEDAALQAAGAAMVEGRWSDAYSTLLDADRAGALDSPAAITLLAQSAYLSGGIEAAIRAFERLFTRALDQGDQEAAAAAAGQIAFLLFDAVMYAPSRAWVRRAEGLIADRPESPVRALLRTMNAWHALVAGDFDDSLSHAREAVALAGAAKDRDTLAIARLAEGQALIALGGVDEGLAILDEASVAAVSGELNPSATGVVFCTANCAFQAVSDFERAEQWTVAMERWSARAGLTGFRGRCRVHRAQLKRLHGEWQAATAEAEQATDELGQVVPAERGWALTELGLIRLRQGDLVGAEALFMEARVAGWEPQPGLALLRLAQGNVAGAVSAIGDALQRAAEIASRELPPQGALRRAPLLAAQGEIAIAANDLAVADAAATELEGVADTYRTPALRATALGARGATQLARGDHAAALRSLQAALDIWLALDAPFEAARTRLGVAAAARAAGNEGRAELEYRTAHLTFQRLEAVLDARRAKRDLSGVTAGDQEDAAPERQARTFMFTDIVKSTNLLAAIGDDAWHHVLRWHNETLASLIERHRGTVVDRAGDGFFATFEREADAVEAAVAIQRGLVEHRRTAGFAASVRIGVHATEATAEGGNWSGIGIHAAARIAALAEGEEILASRGTVERAGLELGHSEPRTVTLRGIDDPVEVVSVDWRSEPG
jgi:class 3 adenylate cyclase